MTESTHDQLVEAYLEYFRASEWWERKQSVRAYAAVQKATRDIRRIAKERNTEIRLIQEKHTQNKKAKREQSGN